MYKQVLPGRRERIRTTTFASDHFGDDVYRNWRGKRGDPETVIFRGPDTYLSNIDL